MLENDPGRTPQHTRPGAFVPVGRTGIRFGGSEAEVEATSTAAEAPTEDEEDELDQVGRVYALPDALMALLRPKSEAEAKARQAQRDLDNAETLISIVRRHHDGTVEGLTEDDIYVLVGVAFRLRKRVAATWGRVRL